MFPPNQSDRKVAYFLYHRVYITTNKDRAGSHLNFGPTCKLYTYCRWLISHTEPVEFEVLRQTLLQFAVTLERGTSIQATAMPRRSRDASPTRHATLLLPLPVLVQSRRRRRPPLWVAWRRPTTAQGRSSRSANSVEDLKPRRCGSFREIFFSFVHVEGCVRFFAGHDISVLQSLILLQKILPRQ